MRLASLFPATNSPRVRSISGLLLASESSPTSPPDDDFSMGRVRQSMFSTDTIGTLTRIKRVHRASVPEGTISRLTQY